jgi:hypothetical protein
MYKEGAARRFPNSLQRPSFTQSSSSLQDSHLLTTKMPSLKSLFGILALGALSATAAPAGQSDPVEAGTVMARQQQVEVRACKDIKAQGDCRVFNMPSGSCCKSKLQLFSPKGFN